MARWLASGNVDRVVRAPTEALPLGKALEDLIPARLSTTLAAANATETARLQPARPTW